MSTKKSKCCEKCYEVILVTQTSSANEKVVINEQIQCSNPFCPNCHWTPILPPITPPLEVKEWSKDIRGEIEKVLWKHYDPDLAMNAEEVMDDIMPLLSQQEAKIKRDLREKIENNKRMESDYDDEDKRSRRDVRPYNEALEDIIKLLTE